MVFQYGEKTNTTLPAYPSYVEGPMKDYYGAIGSAGGGMLSGLNGYKGGVAGINPNMAWGLGKAQEMGHSSLRDFSGGILGAADGYKPTTVSGASIKGMMDPYAETVGAARMRELGRSYDDARANANASAASGVAFAGSGSGNVLRQAQLDRGEAIDSDNVINGVLSDAWAQAANLASQNAAIENAAGQFNAGQRLQANMGANSAYNDYINRQGSAMDALLTTGGLARAYDQELIDLPWNNAMRYREALQGAPEGQTEITPQYFDPLALIGGLGLKMFGM